MAEAQNAIDKWKEMRPKLVRGLPGPRKVFPHQSLVQAKPPNRSRVEIHSNLADLPRLECGALRRRQNIGGYSRHQGQSHNGGGH